MKPLLRSSVQDNPYAEVEEYKPVEKIDGSYIETAIFSLWKIDLVNLVRTKATLAKEFHLQPSEIDRMPYWEYELFIMQLNELVKSENEKQESEMNKYHVKDAMAMTNPNTMQKMFNPPQMSMPSSINVASPKF